jgi:creatinine amidohydrolase
MVSVNTGPQSWAGKTYSQVREIADEPGSVLVVPVGSIEQHGHHLPVATDTILVESVVEEAAARAAGESEDAGAGEDVPLLVTPPVWTGYSPHHMGFGGTLSLEFEHIMSVLEDVADAGLDNGFDAVVLVNGHGGNKPVVSSAVTTIGRAHSEVQVLGVTYFDLVAEPVAQLRESDVGGMAHGGEFETSLMYHLAPDLVGEEMDAEMMETPYEHDTKDLVVGGPLSAYRPFEFYSESGAIGVPELAGAEKGARLFDAAAVELATLFRAVNEEITRGDA